MALNDPQTATVAGQAVALPRTMQDRTANEYSSADGTVKFTVSHQYGRRSRSIIRFDFTKISANPLTDVKAQISESVYVLVDKPLVGFVSSETQANVTTLTTWLTASSGANLLKVLNGEF